MVDKKSFALTIGSVALTIRSVLWQYDLLLYRSYRQRNRSYCQSNIPNWQSSRSLVNLAQPRKIMIFHDFHLATPKIMKNLEKSWFFMIFGVAIMKNHIFHDFSFPTFFSPENVEKQESRKIRTEPKHRSDCRFDSGICFWFCSNFSGFLLFVVSDLIFSDWEVKNQAQSWKSWFFVSFYDWGLPKSWKFMVGCLFLISIEQWVWRGVSVCLPLSVCEASPLSTFDFSIYLSLQSSSLTCLLWLSVSLSLYLSAKLKFDMSALALSLSLSLSLALSLSKAQLWHAFCGSHKHTLSLLIYMYRFFSQSIYLSTYPSISLSLSLFKLFVFCMLFFSCYHVSLKVIFRSREIYIYIYVFVLVFFFFPLFFCGVEHWPSVFAVLFSTLLFC